MGAGNWVAGGVRRAVSGVAALLPGQPAGPEQPEVSDPAPAAAATGTGAATPAEQPAGPVAEPAATRTRTRTRTPKPTPKPTPTPPDPGPGDGSDEQAGAAAPSPWSADELAGFRAALDAEVVRLREELAIGEADLADLVADSGDGSGDDQADAGSKTFEREHEMSVNANTREMLDQAHRALARIDAGTYGVCERCGAAIAAARLRAFPRATLCISCKQAEERR